MTLLTVLIIKNNHSEGNLHIGTYQHKETNKWASFLYLLKDGEIHRTLLSFDINEKFEGFETQEEANSKMQELVDLAVNEKI